jgi:serine/threonine protein kinase
VSEKLNLTAGTMVGAYRITELIGKGGFSEVWSGWDTHLNRLVAIKMIPRVGTDAHNTIQFGREAAMVTRLEHPHILPLYDFGETPDYRYLVMRYVTGGSLAQRLEHGALSISEIVRLMQPIAETLDYIHEQRVVHRDLKPGNILLDAQDLPYVTDFGLAKELTDETRPMHSASGTLTYMPPEQFSGGSMSVRSDQYSFGILLYQLFTGELPYEGRVALGMRQLATQERMSDVTIINPRLPARLNEYLWQLTDPDPNARPESASEVMQKISEVLHGVDGSETPTVQGITFALESGAYRHREAETLIQQNLDSWLEGTFALSLTHFVLLDILLHDLRSLATENVRTLMLRGALEYNQQIDRWWGECSDEERQIACWHAVLNGSDIVGQRALTLAVTTSWVREVSTKLLNKVGSRLIPVSEFTPVILEFLERALPERKQWWDDDELKETDDNLSALAMSRSQLAPRAASLIGTAHRTRAAAKLPTTFRQANPILIAYETAGTLPDSISRVEKFRLLLMLAFRQLTRNPVNALIRYSWAALGSVIAMALIVYITFRALDPANLLSATRILNTIGLGLMYGLIYGAGVWAARHIGQRLLIAPYWLRTTFGAIVGGVIVAFGMSLFQQLVYVDEIDPRTSIISGILYVVGFAASVGLPIAMQLVLGSAGVALAFLIPWTIYLNDPDFRPPFIFDEENPDVVAPLIITASLLVACVTLGYFGWQAAKREVARRRTEKLVETIDDHTINAGEIGYSQQHPAV